MKIVIRAEYIYDRRRFAGDSQQLSHQTAQKTLLNQVYNNYVYQKLKPKKMKKLLMFIALLCCPAFLWAQKDTEFWFAPPEVSQNGSNWLDRPIVLRITTYGTASTVTISQPAGGGMPNQVVTVPSNSTQTVDLTSYISMLEGTPANTVLNYGIKIVATQPISVYYEVISNNGGTPSNPEAFTLKGKNALGNSFYIPSQNLVPNHSSYTPLPYSSFDIVATKDNTNVTITPSNNVVGHTAGIPYTIMLNAGQTYSATATSQAGTGHLNGSRVTSTEPIAITVKDDLLHGSAFGGNCADLAGDQIVPVNLLGTKYIAIKGQLNSPGDYLFVTATQNGTAIFKDGSTSSLATLNAGQTYSFPIGSGASTYIQTSLPAYVWQLSGSGCELGATLLPHIVCTGSNAVSYVRSALTSLYLNLLVPSGAQSSFLINGSALSASAFAAVPGTGGTWMAASIPMPIALYPQGSVISVTNATAKFHMSAIDIHGGGTNYAYFSDYGGMSVTAAATPNPVCVGSGLQLSANSVPGASYTWSGPSAFGSSTFQNPLIFGTTFGHSGTYTVTATQDGCQASASVNVSVIKCPHDCIIEAGYCLNFNNPYTLNFYASGNPGSGVFVWDFGDGSSPIPTGTGSVSHTYSVPGSYTVTVTYTAPDGGVCVKDYQLCVAENMYPEADKKQPIQLQMDRAFIGELYPNPTHTVINIRVRQWNKKSGAKAVVIVYSIEGKKIFSSEMIIPDSGLLNIPLKNLNSGTYLCEVSYGKDKAVRKFVKL